MNIVILTSLRSGTASYVIEELMRSSSARIALVVYNEGVAPRPKGHWSKRWKKIRKIGLLGAINGIRMRPWFQANVVRELGIRDIFDVCREHGIPLETTPSIGDKRTVELFRSVDATLGVSLGNGYIPSKVFTIPKMGMINMHGEILPDYKNAQSVIWQIHDMHSTTGYTIHRIDKGIDTGAILMQERIPIEFQESLDRTVTITCAAILRAAARGLVKLLADPGTAFEQARSQTGGSSRTTPSFSQYLRMVRNHRKLFEDSRRDS